MSDIEKDEKQTRFGKFSSLIVLVFALLGIIIAVNQIFFLKLFGFMPIGTAYYYYILGTFLSLVFLIFPARNKDKDALPWYDWVLFVLCILSNCYLAMNALNILQKGWEYAAPLLPTITGGILWLLVLEGVRRTGGKILFIICFVFSLYPLYGDYLPGIFWGSPYTFSQSVTYHSMGVESIIGIPLQVVGNILIGFILFGVALVATGGSEFFMKFAMSLMGKNRGGAAKVSIISSAFMASLSGSVISNIVTTGSMTIPAMKKTGYSAKYAAAVESCASTGGTLTPPIMGAAGFLIASFLAVPYTHVMLAAAFPAILYYITLFLQADKHAAKTGIKGLPEEMIPSFKKTLYEGWFYLGAIVVLIFILIYMRIEAWAPFLTIVFLFFCALVNRHTRFSINQLKEFLFESGRLVSQITGILAGIGLIVGSLSGTGVANSFSRELVFLAGDNYILLLVLGALTSFILGIGMTVTACYIFLAIVLVPALVHAGLDPMACHLFVLYWGCLSYITPPVALGSITASTISGSDPMATGWLSMRLAPVIYIIPFFFVLNPALILRGPLVIILISVFTAIIGALFLSVALEGWFYFYGRISFVYRIVSFIVGILFLYPYWVVSLAGVALGILMILSLFMFNRPKILSVEVNRFSIPAPLGY